MGYVRELYMRPARLSSGTVALSSSAIFPTTLKSILVKPVILPPGRAKLATKPQPTGSFTMTNTTGIVEDPRFRRCGDRAAADYGGRRERHQSRSDRPDSVRSAARPLNIDAEITALGPANMLQRAR